MTNSTNTSFDLRGDAQERSAGNASSPESRGDGSWPSMAQDYIDHGLILVAAGRKSTAVRLYRQALRLEPDNALAHYVLGLALKALGKSREARTEWAEAVQSQQPGAEAAWARGRAQDLLKRFPE